MVDTSFKWKRVYLSSKRNHLSSLDIFKIKENLIFPEFYFSKIFVKIIKHNFVIYLNNYDKKKKLNEIRLGSNVTVHWIPFNANTSHVCIVLSLVYQSIEP